jgi:hypothetical protein
LVLAAIAAGSISAQGSDTGAKNWISGEISIFGVGARYERILTPEFSVGVDTDWSSLFFFWNELEVGLFGRLYPWETGFFVEAGLGYHIHTALGGDDGAEAMAGVAISPAVGWKIDVGRPGRLFITPGVKLPITLGVNDVTDKFGVGIGIVPYFAVGGAF